MDVLWLIFAAKPRIKEIPVSSCYHINSLRVCKVWQGKQGACCEHICVSVRGILTEGISNLLWWEVDNVIFWLENQINNWTKFFPVFYNMNLNSGHWIQQRLCEFIVVNCLHHLSHGTDLNCFFVPNYFLSPYYRTHWVFWGVFDRRDPWWGDESMSLAMC